jgi:hypothetical protein
MRIIKERGDRHQFLGWGLVLVLFPKSIIMNTLVTPDIREVMEAVHYRPAVSVIMPFEPKMNLKETLIHSLKMAADRVEVELFQQYNNELAALVMQKLRAIIRNLNFNTHKKSVAIYVSPVFEKVLYLDIAVEEKIIVDESFEIRDLVYSKKELHKYLLLLLSAKESRMYLGNSGSFVRIVSSKPERAEAYRIDAAERVTHFSDKSEHREVLMDKFLHHIDQSLDIVLNAYHLPLFVLGADRILGHFKSLTKHRGSVIEYIKGNYEEDTMDQLATRIAPHIANWKKVKQHDLLNQLEEAAGSKKLAVGMKEVWREAMNKNGRLLVVEKDFMYPAEHGSSVDVIYKAVEPYNRFSYIKDAVDDVMEKVLENGGDVEFVDKDVLAPYDRVALVLFH